MAATGKQDTRRELRLQEKCVKYFSLMYPKMLYTHIPMMGGRNNVGKAKRMGTTPGMPDLIILLPPEYLARGLAVEFKRGRHSLRPHQRLVKARLEEELKWRFEICYSLDAFIYMCEVRLHGKKDPKTLHPELLDEIDRMKAADKKEFRRADLPPLFFRQEFGQLYREDLSAPHLQN